MGSVHPYQSASGKRYVVRFKKPDNSQGAKRGFRTKREAEDFLLDVESSRRQGVFLDPQASKARVDQLGKVWLEAKLTSMKPSSYAPVEAAWRLRVQPRWGSRLVSDIVFTDVRAWVSDLNRASGATVVIRTYGVLASILDDAVRDGRIPRNPARAGDVGLPRKVRGRHLYLSHQEVLRLAEASGSRQPLILTLAYTGIRWGEAAALRVEDLDFAKARLHVERNAVEVQGVVHLGTRSPLVAGSCRCRGSYSPCCGTTWLVANPQISCSRPTMAHTCAECAPAPTRSPGSRPRLGPRASSR